MAIVISIACAAANAASAIGPLAMRGRQASLAARMADSPLGAHMVLQSQEADRRIDGDAYVLLDHSFSTVSGVLTDAGKWCDVMILHLNTKYCRQAGEGASTRIDMRVGKKQEQSVHTATLLSFDWRQPVIRADYFSVEMQAPDGPYDTRDYQIIVEAVPVDGGHTFLHLGYAFSYGGASRFAMQLYLATVGRDKVGFTVTEPARSGQEPIYVGGMRGVVERNTMRYYLAINAYLDSLAAPADKQLEKRFRDWFDATERFPRQLHEVDRDAYLRMKRNEYQRQVAGG
jgi:hypothetical protein